MSQVFVSTNAKEWSAAMKAWLKVKRRASHDDCINKFGSESCFKAMQYTRKAPKSKITVYNPQKGGKTFKQKLLYAMASKNGIRKGKGGNKVMRPYVDKVYKSRVRGIGVVKAGFIKPATDLGKQMAIKPYGGGSASKSKGQKSIRFRMKAKSFNEVSGSGIHGYKPMQRAMAFVVHKEHNWAINRLQKANNSYSSKKFR
jgi:hypothetical protein